MQRLDLNAALNCTSDPLNTLAHAQGYTATFSFEYMFAQPKVSMAQVSLSLLPVFFKFMFFMQSYFGSWDATRIITIFHMIETWTNIHQQALFLSQRVQTYFDFGQSQD